MYCQELLLESLCIRAQQFLTVAMRWPSTFRGQKCRARVAAFVRQKDDKPGESAVAISALLDVICQKNCYSID